MNYELGQKHLLYWGEIPVAAVASKPLMSNHAAATKKITRKEHHARTYNKLLF